MGIEDFAAVWDTSTNVRAFARMLRVGEGTADDDGYRRIFGGSMFAEFKDHPRKAITKGRLTSTAAGAYQFLSRTWDGLVKLYGFKDFSPRNQDLACVALIFGRKALEDVVSGRFEQAVMKCNKEWASLPGSPYGQPVVTMARAKEEYEFWGGKYTEEQLAPFTREILPRANQLVQEKPMAPFIAAALPAVISAVPELVKIFGSGSDVAQRNEKAVGTVMEIAKAAIGAKNEQELVTSIEGSAEAATAVRDAIKENWYMLAEVGGGIKEAREFSLKAQGDKGLLANPAFVISLVLIVMPLMLLVDVFYVHPDNYAADGLRTQIVTGVLMVISMVGGFWLGTSFSSAKKDDHILARI